MFKPWARSAARVAVRIDSVLDAAFPVETALAERARSASLSTLNRSNAIPSSSSMSKDMFPRVDVKYNGAYDVEGRDTTSSGGLNDGVLVAARATCIFESVATGKEAVD